MWAAAVSFSGNAVNNTTGNKYQRETDFSGAGPYPPLLARHYNSQSTIGSGAFGANWSHGYVFKAAECD